MGMFDLIDYIKPDDSKSFMPKPFVFADAMLGDPVKVYLPGQSMYVPYSDGFALKDLDMCLCVHMCDQFFAYPTTDFGIRIIPKHTTCRFGGRCHASRLLMNGEPTRKNIDLNSRWIRRDSVLLKQTEKTK